MALHIAVFIQSLATSLTLLPCAYAGAMSSVEPSVQTASEYSSIAQRYIDLFGAIEQAEKEDRELIAAWAEGVRGPVLDAGCGPGRWTQFISGPQRPATGVDMVPEFLAHAAKSYSECTFKQGDLSNLSFSDNHFAGLLAWYSVIHTPPEQLPSIFSEFARVLNPGGQLLTGFFAGDKVQPFAHKVAPAWYLPPRFLVGLLENAGFELLDSQTRSRPTARLHGHVVAQLKS